jgi:hypothetical protein
MNRAEHCSDVQFGKKKMRDDNVYTGKFESEKEMRLISNAQHTHKVITVV